MGGEWVGHDDGGVTTTAAAAAADDDDDDDDDDGGGGSSSSGSSGIDNMQYNSKVSAAGAAVRGTILYYIISYKYTI